MNDDRYELEQLRIEDAIAEAEMQKMDDYVDPDDPDSTALRRAT